MLKHKTIFLKNSFVNFATSILMIIDKYFIIFGHLLTITKAALYITFSRLLDDKSIMKFIKKNSMTLQTQTENSAFYKIYDKKL